PESDDTTQRPVNVLIAVAAGNDYDDSEQNLSWLASAQRLSLNASIVKRLLRTHLVRVIDSRLQISRQDLHAGFFQYACVVPRYGQHFDAAGNPLAPS